MEKRFAVVNHEYMNTGGHCMVSVFAVYDHTVKATRYFCCNDEGFNWQMVDTICNEPPDGLDYGDVYIYSYDWDALTCEPAPLMPQFTEEEFELFKYCQFEFYKKYCADFKIRVELPIDQISNEMYKELGTEVITQHKVNEWNVYTDGYHAYPNELYDESLTVEYGEDIKAVIDFKEWLDHITFTAEGDVNEALVDKKFTIVFNGRSLELDFCAASFTGIVDALQYVIDQE